MKNRAREQCCNESVKRRVAGGCTALQWQTKSVARWVHCIAMAERLLQWWMGCCNGGWDVAMADGMLQWRMGCCNGGQADAMADGMLQDGRWDVAMVDAWLQW